MIKFKNIIIVVFSGIILSSAYFPLPLVYKTIVPYFIFIPLLFILDSIKNKLEYFTVGVLFGISLITPQLYWLFVLQIEDVNFFAVYSGIILLILLIGLQYGIGFLIYGIIKRFVKKSFVFILIFPLIEYFRGLGASFGFQWGILPLTQSYSPLFFQYCDIFGAYSVTTVILLSNYIMFKYFKSRNRKFILVEMLLFISIILYGVISQNIHKSNRYINVSYVQPNVSPYIKHRSAFIDKRFKILIEMSDKLKKDSTDLIIWPETASPVYLNYRVDILNNLRNYVDSLNIPILTGTPIVDIEYKKPIRYFNGAMLIIPYDSFFIYRKMYPVPFVERIPYSDKISILNKLDFGQGHYSVGKEYTVFRTNGFKFSAIICFESMFEKLSRGMTRNGAEFIINITEDAWFGKTYFSYMHNAFLPIRAVENRRSIVRCANTGISCYIDQWGNVKNSSAIFTKSLFSDRISLISEISIYSRFGYLYPFILMIIILYLLIISFRRLYENRKN
jgi:apolipoprotein N-acyltransferase